MHGAKAGAPKGNLNGILHGAYVKRVLNEDELKVYTEFIEQLKTDFVLNESSDQVAAHLAGMSLVQYMRASRAGKDAAAELFARIIRNNLKDLKATKSARETESDEIKTTPAEWAAALLERARRVEEEAAARQKEQAESD